MSEVNDRDRDAAVAEKVMGLNVVGTANAWHPEGDWGICAPPEGTLRPVFVRHCICDISDDETAEYNSFLSRLYGFSRLGGHRPNCLDVVPCYSTDIAAAWTLLLKFTGERFNRRAVILSCTEEDGLWRCTIGAQDHEDDNAHVGTAATAPEAIVLAALAALEAQG